MTDEEWIEAHQSGDWHDDMRAALARGREQGRATCEYERELLDIARKQRDGALTEVKRLQREIAKARGLIERAEAYLAAAVRLRTPREYPTVLLDDLRRYLGGA